MRSLHSKERREKNSDRIAFTDTHWMDSLFWLFHSLYSISLGCPCCLSVSGRTHSYSLYTLHLCGSHIFHRYTNTRSHTRTNCTHDGSFLAILTVFRGVVLVCWYESVSCVLSYSIFIARFLSFFLYFSLCVYAFSSSLSCRCFSYFICCLCVVEPRIQFEWWFYAQSDFILSEVVFILRMIGQK